MNDGQKQIADIEIVIMIMDMVNRVLILTLLIGLASAQINFSTSWGKRSSALSSAAGPSFPSLRQQHNLHSRREASQSSSTQQQTLPESLMSGSANVYGGEPSADEQPRTVQLPSACLSLLKSLLLVNQITEVSYLFHFNFDQLFFDWKLKKWMGNFLSTTSKSNWTPLDGTGGCLRSERDDRIVESVERTGRDQSIYPDVLLRIS